MDKKHRMEMWRRLVGSGRRPSGCPDESVLLAFLARQLPQAEQTSLMQHLVHCNACQLVLAAAQADPPPTPPMTREDLARVKRLVQALPIASLTVGVAPQAMKIVRHSRVTPLRDKALQRLQHAMVGNLFPCVTPADRGNYFVHFEGFDISLHLRANGDMLRATFQLPRLRQHPALRYEFLEDDNLLFSDTLMPHGSPEPMDLRLGQRYRLVLSGAMRAEVTLASEPFTPGPRDLTALALYHFASGDTGEAVRSLQGMAWSDFGDTAAGAPVQPGALLTSFLRYVPEMKTCCAAAKVRGPRSSTPPTLDASQDVELLPLIRRLLREADAPIDLERLDPAAPDMEETTRLRDKVRALANRNGDERLRIVDRLLTAWIELGLRDAPVNIMLSALANALDQELRTADK